MEVKFDSTITAVAREKLIKLADRSACGWATVSAYLTDDLADTPDNERRISKAEKSAKKALESKREKSRVKSGFSNYKSNHASFSFVSDSRRGPDDAFKSFRQPFQPPSLVDQKAIG